MRQGWLQNAAARTKPRNDGFTGLLGRDMAIDLGTANTLVYVRGRGIVLNEPSVVAVNTLNSDILAAAIGAGLPIHEPTGNMIVDIGGGTTEVAVISLGGVVTATSVRVGGDELDESIINHVKKEYSVALGERTSEAIKLAVGSAFPSPDDMIAEIKGRDLVSGLPKTIHITSEEVRKAIEEPVNAIVDAVRDTLDRCPPELAADVMDKGIVLTGGGALLRGLDERLKHETSMPIHVAEEPLHSVAFGSGRCIEEFESLKKVLIASEAH